MSVETDSHGRIYLPADLRDKYGERFHVVEYSDRIELVPIEPDPLDAVRDEIGDTLADQSREDLRTEALERARREASDDLERDDRE